MTQDNESTPPTPPTEADNEERRGRGRPTIAEIEAKRAELERREADIADREAAVELAAAEANLAMREAELVSRETQVAAARSGTVRTGTVRSAELTAPVRGRRYKGGMDMPDRFFIPPSDIPLGISYQWNNHTVFGQEQHSYSSFMGMQGWEPVHSSRHPHLCPTGYDGPIIVDGQILVERPAEWTNEALQEELDKARGEVRMKEEQLYGTPAGTMPRARANGTNEFVSVKKDVEPGAPVPRNYQYESPGQGGVVIE